MRYCIVNNCKNKSHGKGLCVFHYNKMYKSSLYQHEPITMKRNPEFDSLYAKYFDESEIKSEVDWSVIFNRFKKLDNLITR